MVSSIGYSNGYAQYPQYVSQRQAYMPQQAVSFAGTPTAEEQTENKKSSAGKIVLGTVATLAVAGAALYGLFKTGKLTKVDNASKWTEKLQNLAYKGGEGIDKVVTKAIGWGKGLFDSDKKKALDAAESINQKAQTSADAIQENIISKSRLGKDARNALKADVLATDWSWLDIRESVRQEAASLKA